MLIIQDYLVSKIFTKFYRPIIFSLCYLKRIQKVELHPYFENKFPFFKNYLLIYIYIKIYELKIKYKNLK